MEYGLATAGDYETLLDAVDLARERGLAAFALPDHYLLALDEEGAKTTPAPDAFAQLAGLARDTEDIDLVILVTPVTFRHPAVIAKTAVTIDRMSGGRFVLGVGTGWLEREHEVFGIGFPPTAERFAMLEETLGYLEAAFDPDHPGFRGDRYTLEAFPLAPPPLRRIPLLVGGTGAHKTPRLAGRFASEFNVYPGPDMADRIARCRAAATEAGRDPGEILISSAGQVVAAETEADFEALMHERADEAGITRDELESYFEQRQTPRGTYEQVRSQFDRFETLGVGRFYVQSIFAPGGLADLLDGLGIGT